MSKKLEVFKEDLLKNCEAYNIIINRLEKLEKAIEILKNKRVCMFTLLSVPKCEYYNNFCHEDDKLTEEEFNLLKEVLEEWKVKKR